MKANYFKNKSVAYDTSVEDYVESIDNLTIFIDLRLFSFTKTSTVQKTKRDVAFLTVFLQTKGVTQREIKFLLTSCMTF